MATRASDYDSGTQAKIRRLRSISQRIETDKTERNKLIRELRGAGVVTPVVADAAGVSEAAIYQVVNPPKRKSRRSKSSNP